ncbi:hypothetical protein D3C85_1283240 [compost metagenome]
MSIRWFIELSNCFSTCSSSTMFMINLAKIAFCKRGATSSSFLICFSVCITWLLKAFSGPAASASIILSRLFTKAPLISLTVVSVGTTGPICPSITLARVSNKAFCIFSVATLRATLYCSRRRDSMFPISMLLINRCCSFTSSS